MKNKISAIIKPTISLGLIFFLISRVDIWRSFSVLKNINLIYYSCAITIILIAWFINSRKWQNILNHLKINNKIFTLFKLNLISIFYTTILPGGQLTGEIIKYCRIENRQNNRKEIIASIFFDRLNGLIALVILGFFCLTLSNLDDENYSSLLIIFSGFLSGVFLILFAFTKPFIKIFTKIKDIVTAHHNINIIKKIYSVLSLFSQKYKLILKTLGYGLIFQTLGALAQLFIAKSLNIEISFFDIAWMNTLISLAILIPISIAGVGIRELGYVQLFAMININDSQALAFSILITLTTFLIGTIGGLFEIKNLFFKNNNDQACQQN